MQLGNFTSHSKAGILATRKNSRLFFGVSSMKIKMVLYVILGAGAAWVGRNGYEYFFDKSQPEILFRGIDSEHYYAGDVQCFISCNRPGELTLWLDGQPLASNFKVTSADKECPFTVPTKPLQNGKHELKLHFADNRFNKNSLEKICSFSVDNTPLQAAFVKPDAQHKVFQGRTLHVQFQVNKDIKDARVSAFAEQYPCFPEAKRSTIYEAFIPVTCEETPNEYPLQVELTDNVGNALKLESKFQVVSFPFKKEVITVSAEKIAQEEQAGESSAKREEIMQQLTHMSPHEKLWRGSFCAPIEIERVSCDFGTVRTTQHKGRYAHKAVDLVNSPKSVVWAPQDGVVVLKERFADSGNTVAIDHGWGIMSLFYHLDDFSKITIGDKVAQGNPIGTIGKTGFATGYHLHWELRVGNVQVDPMQWIKPLF